MVLIFFCLKWQLSPKKYRGNDEQGITHKDDNDAYNYDQKVTFNASFGLGAGYNFTKNLGVGADARYGFSRRSV